jgi:hypothetical protein
VVKGGKNIKARKRKRTARKGVRDEDTNEICRAVKFQSQMA